MGIKDRYYKRIKEIDDFCCDFDLDVEVFHFEKFIFDKKLNPTPKVVDVLWKDFLIEFKRVIPNEKRGNYKNIEDLQKDLVNIANLHLKEWKIEEKFKKSKELAKKYLDFSLKKDFVLFCYAEEKSFSEWLKRVIYNNFKLAMEIKAGKIDILEIYDKFYEEIKKGCKIENGNCDKFKAKILIESGLNEK